MGWDGMGMGLWTNRGICFRMIIVITVIGPHTGGKDTILQLHR